MMLSTSDHVTAAVDGALVALVLAALGWVALPQAALLAVVVYASLVMVFQGYRRNLRALQPAMPLMRPITTLDESTTLGSAA